MIADSRLLNAHAPARAGRGESEVVRHRRRGVHHSTVHALLVVMVPLGALAALAGAHSGATVPILAAASAVFLAARARVASGDWLSLDAALVALAAGVFLQVVPLPPEVVTFLSPHLQAVRSALFLESSPGWVPLTVDATATRSGLASLAAALFVFWTSREVLARHGLRKTASAIAAAGFLLVIVTLIQRATEPRLLLWTWKPSDPEAMPFGPFVNRNHLATWLVMAASLTTGYLVSHTHAIAAGQPSLRLKVRDWLADGKGLLLAGAVLVMLLGIAATLSRAGILGAGAALMTGVLLTRGAARGRTASAVGGLAFVLLAAGVWLNADAFARKFDSSTAVSRAAIWRHTLPIVGDFWATGTGTGTYGATMLHYQRVLRDVHFNQAHNEYLQVAAEGGVLVGIPMFAACVAGVRLARRRLRQDLRAIGWMRVGAAAGLVGVAVQNLFETGLRTPANGLLAAVLAAIVLHDAHER